MVVFNIRAVVDKYFSVSQPRGRGPNNIGEPRSGIALTLENRIGWANHVQEDHGLHAPQVPRKPQASGKLPASIGIVRIDPARIESFLAVKKRQPDGIRVFSRT